ncbi:MAG: cation diffusion facilitator family transporter [Magnetococcus sp. DMHC-6]
MSRRSDVVCLFREHFFNTFLTLFKGILGVISGSAALVADAFHSAADVLATYVTMVSVKISHKPADNLHPYGHGKVQYFSTMITGLILFIGAVFIFVGAVKAIISGYFEAPNTIALLGAIVSIVINEGMFRYQTCVGTEHKSPAILANAWDNRSDAIASSAVLFGIAMALFGYPIADSLAALVVSLIIMKIGWELIVEAVHGLIDVSADMNILKELYEVIRATSGVLEISFLRARVIGDGLHIETHLQVDANMKIYEGDLLVAFLNYKIKRIFGSTSVLNIFLSTN